MAVIRNGVGQRLMRNLFRTISLARFVDKLWKLKRCMLMDFYKNSIRENEIFTAEYWHRWLLDDQEGVCSSPSAGHRFDHFSHLFICCIIVA